MSQVVAIGQPRTLTVALRESFDVPDRWQDVVQDHPVVQNLIESIEQYLGSQLLIEGLPAVGRIAREMQLGHEKARTLQVHVRRDAIFCGYFNSIAGLPQFEANEFFSAWHMGDQPGLQTWLQNRDPQAVTVSVSGTFGAARTRELLTKLYPSGRAAGGGMGFL